MLGAAALGLIFVITTLYLWIHHNFTYWQRRGVHQPSWTFWIKSSLDVLLMKDSYAKIYDRLYRLHPDKDVVGVYGIHKPKLLVRSPRLIRQVMVSDFSSFHDNEFNANPRLDPYFSLDPFCIRGERWKPSRARISYYITSGRIKELFPLMKEMLPKLDSYIDNNSGKEMDMKELATLFFMDNISNNVLGIASNCFTDPNNDFQKMADLQMEIFLKGQWRSMVMNNLPYLRDLLGLSFVPKTVNDYLENLIKEVFNYRKQNNFYRQDLLQHIMKREGDSEGDPLADMTMVAVMFFIEGFESSSMTAAPVLLELALNPPVQDTLYQELRETFGDTFNPEFDSIHSLPYLDQVVQESSRKCPILYGLARLCTQPTTLEVNGNAIRIEPGTPVVLPCMAVQKDPVHFPDPELFDPERFSETNKSQVKPGTFFPFGDGPRMCPGVKFGQTQIKLLIASVVYKYRLVRTKKTPSTVTFLTGSFLAVPQQPFLVTLEKRHH